MVTMRVSDKVYQRMLGEKYLTLSMRVYPSMKDTLLTTGMKFQNKDNPTVPFIQCKVTEIMGVQGKPVLKGTTFCKVKFENLGVVTGQMSELQRCREFLKRNGWFESVQDESGVTAAHEGIDIAIDLVSDNQTQEILFYNASGTILVTLPLNYYALIGAMIENRLISCAYKSVPKSNSQSNFEKAFAEYFFCLEQGGHG
ncbi:MAG: hypothetical protein GWN00_01075 [Aliifodinibius sp.]|nr:hypothetical protein [Fodinibius sp.]NIV09923.1 hypothetical protein [Fodinibius sp.]NIY23453.1 hypothetical protein [Fodinibius sp.]